MGENTDESQVLSFVHEDFMTNIVNNMCIDREFNNSSRIGENVKGKVTEFLSNKNSTQIIFYVQMKA